jgi:hypothetical protein
MALPNHDNCALCSQEEETLDHLLVRCVYSQEVWFRIFRSQGWQALILGGQDTTIEWWLASRKRVHKSCPDSRAKFDSIFALLAW